MKIFISLALLLSITFTGLAQTPEVKVVKNFLNLSLLQNKSEANKKKRKALISPSYKKAKGFKADTKINMYAPTDFKILSQNGKMVITEIWSTKYKWKKQLYFDVEKENGKYYIVPNQKAFVSSSNRICAYKRSDKYVKGQWSVEYNPKGKKNKSVNGVRAKSSGSKISASGSSTSVDKELDALSHGMSGADKSAELKKMGVSVFAKRKGIWDSKHSQNFSGFKRGKQYIVQVATANDKGTPSIWSGGKRLVTKAKWDVKMVPTTKNKIKLSTLIVGVNEVPTSKSLTIKYSTGGKYRIVIMEAPPKNSTKHLSANDRAVYKTREIDAYAKAYKSNPQLRAELKKGGLTLLKSYKHLFGTTTFSGLSQSKNYTIVLLPYKKEGVPALTEIFGKKLRYKVKWETNDLKGSKFKAIRHLVTITGSYVPSNGKLEVHHPAEGHVLLFEYKK